MLLKAVLTAATPAVVLLTSGLTGMQGNTSIVKLSK